MTNSRRHQLPIVHCEAVTRAGNNAGLFEREPHFAAYRTRSWMETRLELVATALDIVLAETPPDNFQPVIKAALQCSQEERIASLDIYAIADEIRRRAGLPTVIQVRTLPGHLTGGR